MPDVPQKVLDLVDIFDRNSDEYRAPDFNEANLRIQFVNPLFKALDWDMDNDQGHAEAYKDVIHEASLKIGGETKAPDYCFRIGGTPKFYLEAKKPAVNIKDDPAPAFQLRRYGWSKKLPLSILTDFEEFAVYDCRYRPSLGDKASDARIMYLRYTDYAKKWDEIASIFSKAAILKGSFDKYAVSAKAKRGTATVDAAFLEEIENWRFELAKNLAWRNHQLSPRELNYAVQITIDRIIFLRMCEDRGIEPYGQLRTLALHPNIYAELVKLFDRADQRYNSGLFHFQEETGRAEQPDGWTPKLAIDDKVLKAIFKTLYYPDSPYEFSVLPAEILGHVYEQFLGKVIRLTTGHQAKVEEKPEVKKAGGVYYTPTYIVDYIVKHTVGKLLGSEPDAPARDDAVAEPDAQARVATSALACASGSLSTKQALKLRILDPACGSGSFLLGAYDFLLAWYLKQYAADPAKYKKEIFQAQNGEYRLTTAERKKILVSNIYGVDIDPQAVEVTKLSLLLKVLEGESQDSLERQLLLFHGERALPDLASNIKCGNSLIGPDFYETEQPSLFDEEEKYRINVFDWNTAFPEIMKGGGFDVVIGNPPWLMAGYHLPDSMEYLHRAYESATGKFDLYYTFIEKGCRLLSARGLFGMIVPNKFFHTSAASSLRRMLTTDRWIKLLVDFGDAQIFAGATNYSCLVFLERKHGTDPIYRRAADDLKIERQFAVPWEMFDAKTWYFEDQTIRQLFEKMETVGVPLEKLVARFGTGVQSGADKILTLDEDAVQEKKIEPDLLRAIYRGRDVRRYVTAKVLKKLVFPYEEKAAAFRPLPESTLQTYKAGYALLAAHKNALAKRIWFGKTAEQLSGKWYGLMYLDEPRHFAAPHILTPSLSDHSNFALGTGDLFVTGTAGVTSIIPTADLEEGIHYLLAILNSKLLSFYAIRHSPIFSGAFFKFSAPYLRRLPIRRIDFAKQAEQEKQKRIVALVQAMHTLHQQRAGAKTPHERSVLDAQIAAADRHIDRLVYELYGLSADEIKIVEEATAP